MNRNDIKNLSQLKKALVKGARFEITDTWRKATIGQIREVNIVQTNAIYTVLADKPEDPISKANYGKGYYLEYGKAGEWEFADGKCRMYDKKHEELLLEFRVIA